MDLEIHPVTSERFGDLAALFGQGGDPKWCFCTFYRVRGSYWGNTTAEANRATLKKAVRTTAAESRAPGLVAYRDGEAIGWVSPRSRMMANSSRTSPGSKSAHQAIALRRGQ